MQMRDKLREKCVFSEKFERDWLLITSTMSNRCWIKYYSRGYRLIGCRNYNAITPSNFIELPHNIMDGNNNFYLSSLASVLEVAC